MRKIILLLILIIPILSVHAQSAEETRVIVENFLKDQLGREYVLLEYNFEAADWQDSALGCPQEGQTYPPEAIPGYAWNFLIDDGIRYRINSNLDGSRLVLCAQLSESNITYSTFSNSLFTIQHPNLWTAQRNGESEVTYAPRGQIACSLPGATVYVLTNPGTAEAVLNNYLATSTVENRINAPFGTTGSQTVYTTPCENRIRKWQATALTDTNNAYLIVQWTSENLYPIWKPIFGAMLNSFVASSGTAVVQPANVTAPTAVVPLTPTVSSEVNPAVPTETPVVIEVAEVLPAPPTAPVVDIFSLPFIHVFLGDIHIARLNNLPGIPLTQDERSPKSQIIPSPNGQEVAFIQNQTELYTFSLVETRGIELVSDQAAVDFPPAWSLDGTQVAYLRGEETLEIVVNENVLGSVAFTGDCQKETRYLVDRLAQQEDSGLTFAWLPGDKFLYTPNCNGRGLKLWNAGQETDLGENLRRVKISPDLKKAAAINDTGIVLIDLTTLQTADIATTEPPAQLGWDITSTQIYYSALSAPTPTIFDDVSRQAELEPILGIFPYESRLNTVRLYQIDINNRAEILRWEGQNGFAIGRMEGLPDGNGMLFTFIPTDRLFLAAVVNGEESARVFQSMPQTQLFFLPNDSTTAQPLAYTAQPILVMPLFTLRN